jgi:hypothetical protein
MPLSLEQLGHLLVAKAQPDPLTGLPLIEVPLILPTPIGSRFVDSGLVFVPARIKTLVIVVDTAITSGAAQQATVQLYAARTPFAVLGSSGAPGSPPTQPATPFSGGQGAASQFPTTGPNACQAIGVPVNLGPSAATFGGGGAEFWFSPTFPGNPSASPPTSMTELAQEYPVLGIEITAPATFTGGSARAFFELAPI